MDIHGRGTLSADLKRAKNQLVLRNAVRLIQIFFGSLRIFFSSTLDCISEQANSTSDLASNKIAVGISFVDMTDAHPYYGGGLPEGIWNFSQKALAKPEFLPKETFFVFLPNLLQSIKFSVSCGELLVYYTALPFLCSIVFMAMDLVGH